MRNGLLGLATRASTMVMILRTNLYNLHVDVSPCHHSASNAILYLSERGATRSDL